MQIVIKLDPITGIETLTYIEEPKKISKEEQEKNNDFLKDILESLQIHNQFMHRIIESFWSLDVTNFSETWNTISKEYMDYKMTTRKNESEDVKNDFNKSFISKFVDSISNKDNQNLLKNNIVDVSTIWNSQLNSQLLPLLMWQMNFKEQALTVLETTSCEFTPEQYTYVYEEFIKNFRRNDLPLNSVDKDNILNEEQSNFLEIQKKYCTFKKLNDKLIDKKMKTKHIKI